MSDEWGTDAGWGDTQTEAGGWGDSNNNACKFQWGKFPC